MAKKWAKLAARVEALEKLVAELGGKTKKKKSAKNAKPKAATEPKRKAKKAKPAKAASKKAAPKKAAPRKPRRPRKADAQTQTAALVAPPSASGN